MESKPGTVVTVTEHVSQLTEHLNQLQKNDILCDITLKGDNGDVRAHSVVLCAVSPYFKKIITNTCVCNPNVSINVKGFEVDHLKNVLLYIYTGKILISASSVSKITNLLRRFEMPSAVQLILKNFSSESDSSVKCNVNDGGYKENQLSAANGAKPKIISLWSERLKNALRESNNSDNIQESEETNSDVYDLLKKSAEVDSDEKIAVSSLGRSCMIDVNDCISVVPKKKKLVTVDINNCESDKMFNTTKRKGTLQSNKEMDNSSKRDKVSGNGVLSKKETDLLNSFLNRIKREPKFNQYDDGSSSCGSSDIFSELIDSRNDVTPENEIRPLYKPGNMEVVNGIQKSLEFITNNEQRLHISQDRNDLASENKEEQMLKEELEDSCSISESRERVFDDSLSNTSEDIGLLKVALSRGWNKHRSSLPQEVVQKPLSNLTEHNINLTSPMSEVSATYTSVNSDTSIIQSPLLSDTSPSQIPVPSEVKVSMLPEIVVSPEDTEMLEASVYKDQMLSQVNIKQAAQLNKNSTVYGNNSNCGEDQNLLENEPGHSQNQEMMEGKERTQTSILPSLNLLNNPNDTLQNESQCNLDGSFNFSVSSEILNNFQQNNAGDLNPQEMPSSSSMNTNDLSGHQIVEHFENIDQLEMTPELLEAVVNPDFVQHFDNETIVTISQPQIILQQHDSMSQDSGQIVLHTFDSDTNTTGQVIIQSHDGILNQSEEIIIQSHDETVVQSGEITQDTLNKMESFSNESIGINSEKICSADDEWSDGPHSMDRFRPLGMKRITRCRTCGVDFHNERHFKLHRKKHHPIAHMTWLRRTEKRKQLETLLSKIERMKKCKDQSDIEQHKAQVKDGNKVTNTGNSDDQDNDPTYEPKKDLGVRRKRAVKMKGITRCRTCKIDFHDEKKFRRHRAMMHPIAHVTWLKRNEIREQARHLFLKDAQNEIGEQGQHLFHKDAQNEIGEQAQHLFHKDAQNEMGEQAQHLFHKDAQNEIGEQAEHLFHKDAHSVSENVLQDNLERDENDKAGKVLGEIIEKMDHPERITIIDHNASNDDNSSSNDPDIKPLHSNQISLTGRIRRVKYCRTCGINFNCAEEYRAHREKVHPIAHKNWLARNEARQKVTERLQTRSKKSGKKCNFCGLTFPTNFLLKRHHTLKHSDGKRKEQSTGRFSERGLRNRNKCTMCKYVCYDQDMLMLHKEKFHPLINGGPERKKILECKKCDFTAHEMSLLIQHRNEIHQEEVSEPELGAVYSTQDESQVELGEDSGKKSSLTCCICFYEAATEEDVLMHIQQVHESSGHVKDTFSCSQCNYTGSNRAQLNAHMICHSDYPLSRRLKSKLEVRSENDKALPPYVQAGVVEYNNRLLYLGILGDDTDVFTFCKQPLGKLKGSTYTLEFTDQALTVNPKDEFIVSSEYLVSYFNCALFENVFSIPAHLKQKIENDVIKYIT